MTAYESSERGSSIGKYDLSQDIGSYSAGDSEITVNPYPPRASRSVLIAAHTYCIWDNRAPPRALLAPGLLAETTGKRVGRAVGGCTNMGAVLFALDMQVSPGKPESLKLSWIRSLIFSDIKTCDPRGRKNI